MRARSRPDFLRPRGTRRREILLPDGLALPPASSDFSSKPEIPGPSSMRHAIREQGRVMSTAVARLTPPAAARAPPPSALRPRPRTCPWSTGSGGSHELSGGLMGRGTLGMFFRTSEASPAAGMVQPEKVASTVLRRRRTWESSKQILTKVRIFSFCPERDEGGESEICTISPESYDQRPGSLSQMTQDHPHVHPVCSSRCSAGSRVRWKISPSRADG